jgi:signal transduction histidine kinase
MHSPRDTDLVRESAQTASSNSGSGHEPAVESPAATAAAAIAFLATISHEIRTPVNAILGYHELLELGLAGPLNDTQRNYVERASASGRHLLEIVDEVLDFARLDADRVQIARESFPLGAVMSDALTLVAPQARQRHVFITNASSRASQRISAVGDPGRVKQILVNLLSNAIKFTEPRDGGTGRVTVSTGLAEQASPGVQLEHGGTLAFVRVEDTGPGIPPERIETIFEPFVQGDVALTRRHGGSGLGLAISRRLARLMGGELTAHADLGMGSTFLLWLPAPAGQAMDGAGEERRDLERPSIDVMTPLLEPDKLPGRSETIVMIAEAIIDQLEVILARYLERVRNDPRTESARKAAASRIEDHLASFLADLASTLENMEIADREMTEALLDSSAIQRTIAMKHGEQRARLGWHEDEVRREYEIIEEEVIEVMRAGAAQAPGVADTDRSEELQAAIGLVRRFLDTAMRRSVASYRAARAHADRNT